MAIQSFFFNSGSGYFTQFTTDLNYILENVELYLRAVFFAFWDNGYNKHIQIFIFICMGILSILGYIEKLKTNFTVIEIFVPLYLLIIIIWPSFQGYRFLLPILPFYIVYIILGIKPARFIQNKKLSQIIYIFIIILTANSFIGKYTTLNFGTFSEGIELDDSKKLFEYIKTYTQNDDVIVCDKPRPLALYTNRKSAVYHEGKNDQELLFFFKDIEASYLIPYLPGLYKNEYLSVFISRNSNLFEEVYSNNKVKVYKIKLH